MTECGKCHGKCKDDALYCVHCGERLDTAACRRCGNFVKQEEKFCAHCGYPTSGTVCPKCGKSNPDDANFCFVCGSRLTAPAANNAVSANTGAVYAGAAQATVADYNATAPKANTAVADYNATALKANAAVKSDRPSKKAFAYKVSRAFVLPALLVCLFISSFFGMFKMEVPILDIDAEVTGIDAVRGIFLLMDPPTQQEVYENLPNSVKII